MLTSNKNAYMLAALLATSPVASQAGSLNWFNHNPSGDQWTQVDVLGLRAFTPSYTTTVNVGSDHTLSNGDIFHETLSYFTESSFFNNSLTAEAPTGASLLFDYRFDVDLFGTISDVVGTGISVNSSNVVSGINSTTFNVSFNPSTGLPAPNSSVKIYDLATNTLLATMNLLSGGTSNVSLVAGTLLNAITLNAAIDGSDAAYLANGKNYIRDALNQIITDSVLSVTTGSTRVQGVTGNYNNKTLTVAFQDNGFSQTYPTSVPEPESLALLGLGALAMTANRRRSAKA